MSYIPLPLVFALLCAAVVHSNSTIKFQYIDRSGYHGPSYLTERDFRNAELVKYQYDGKIDDSAMYNNDLFEGDIVLPSHLLMKRMAMSPRDPRARRFHQVMRNAIRDRRRQWPNGIVPYEISRHYTQKGRDLIAAAMQQYAKHTCIRFMPRQPRDQDWVSIEPLDGCYSLLGRNGGKQTLSLGDGCMVIGIAEHEMMHCIGFDHEQSRPDRDQYVTIVWDNIKPDARDQFGLDSAQAFDTFGSPYDYGSVMHYGAKDFSRNGQPTIIPKQAGVEIGQRRGFSESDVKEINIYYGCNRRDQGEMKDGIDSGETEGPEITETEAPEPIETENPEPIETEETENPEPTDTEGPEPSETEGPEIIETENPEPTETEETECPEPSETENPEPTETEGPEPSETSPSEGTTTTPGGKGICIVCKHMEENNNCNFDFLDWCKKHCHRCVV